MLIVAAIAIPTLLWADVRSPYAMLALAATVAFGAIGFVDDYNKVVRRRNLGLTAKWKFALQVLTCVGVGSVLIGLQQKGCLLYTSNQSHKKSRIIWIIAFLERAMMDSRAMPSIHPK